MKKIIYTGIIIIIANLLNTLSLNAQDARFAQSYSNPLRINPAIMGANRDLKFGLNYRSQWASIGGGYKTVSFTGLYPIIPKDGNNKFDIGVTAMDDEAGAFSTLDIGLALDYSKELSPHNNVCLSIIGGYVQKSLKVDDQTFDNQYVAGSYSATNPADEFLLNNKVSHPDLGFGFMWFFNPDRTESRINAYLGIAGFHLNEPNQSLLGGTGKLPMRFSYQGGVKIFGDHKLDFSPNIRVNNQNGNLETAAGLYAEYNFNENLKFVVGGWYRAHDAIAVVVGFDHKNFSLGYSYDLISSSLNDATNGIKGNEITLSIKLNRTKKKKTAEGEVTETEVPKAYSNPFSEF